MSNGKALITLRPPKTPLGKALWILPFGIVFLWISYNNFRNDQILASDYTLMKGKVESIRNRSNSRHVTYIVAGKEFHTRTGWFSPYKDAQIGDEVEVMVSNVDPYIASVNSTDDRYEVIVITALIGLIIVTIGMFVLWRK